MSDNLSIGGDMYAGVANKARRVAGAYVGVGGVARKVRGIYSGDEAGIARVVWGKGFAPGVITPSNMTSDSAPTPFVAKAKSVYSGSYAAYRAFNSNNGAGTEGCFSPLLSYGEGGTVVTDGEWWVEIDLGSARFAKERLIAGLKYVYSGGNGPAREDVARFVKDNPDVYTDVISRFPQWALRQDGRRDGETGVTEK